MKRELKVKLETVTPLFLGGADQQPELRPASFRGAMRFWLRALLGGVHGNNLSKIKQDEAAVFGSPDFGSPVTVRIQEKMNDKNDIVINPKSKSGLYYMLWSTQQRDNKRQAYDVRSSFSCTLQTRFGTEEHMWFKAAASFWLLLHLGGLGTRSRRGAGCIRATATPEAWPSGWPSLETKAGNATELAIELEEGIKGWLGLMSQQYASNFTTPSEYDILHPNCCQIYVLDNGNNGWASWEAALNEIGEEFKTFRNRRSPDYESVKKVIQGHHSSITTIERSIFGLPQPYYYSSLKKRATVEAKDRNINRRASPLMFHITRLNSDRYVCVLVFFKAKFLLEKNPKITITHKDKKPKKTTTKTVNAPAIENSLVDDFLESLKCDGSNLNCKEVKFDL